MEFLIEHIYRLIMLFAICGIAGGLASFYLTPEELNDYRNNLVADGKTGRLKKIFSRSGIFKNILFGLVASFLVPLFLNMISSSLMDDSGKDPIKYFYIAGFCLAAASSSRAFILLMSNKIFRMIENTQSNVRGLKEEVDTIYNNQTEPSDETPTQVERLTNETESMTEDEKKLFKAFIESKFIYRSYIGLKKQIDEPDDNKVHEALNLLISKGLVDQMERKDKVRFFLTTKGRIAVSNLNW